ncbi:unnamed protein product [Cunninghamella blakesleeana]
MNKHDHNEVKYKPINTENNVEATINYNDKETKVNPQLLNEEKMEIVEKEDETADNVNKNKRNVKKTKRHLMIEEKIKQTKVRSLFDTDGDISSHNILEPENGAIRATRQSRKRRNSEESNLNITSSNQLQRNQNNNSKVRKTSVDQRRVSNKKNDHIHDNRQNNKHILTPAEKAAELMKQRKESVNQLRPEPKTDLDRVRNEFIRNRELELQKIQVHHDTMIRELAHLEVYQTILDFQPAFFNNDERVRKFMLEYNLWDLANEHLMNKQKSSLGVRTRHITQDQTLPLIKMLQHSTELDALTLTQKSNIPNDTQRQILLQSLPPAEVNYIKSGTGLRRMNRQYPTLDEFLSSFIYLDDADDTNNADIKEYIEKEQSIRKRIKDLEDNGELSATTSKLKEIANRKPQLESISLSLLDREENNELNIHDSIVSQAIQSSKLFRGHTKYRKNAARKCAKAIEKYWENIRTREERLQKEETKRLARLAKWTAQQVKLKWKVVERICEARYKEILKEQQAKKSRRHLEMILEHSEQMLGVRKGELKQHHSLSENEYTSEGMNNNITYDDEKFITPSNSGIEDLDEDQSDEQQQQQHSLLLLTEDETNVSESFMEKGSDDYDENSEQASVLNLDDEDERDHFIDESDMDKESDDLDDLDDLKQDQDLTVEELYEKYKSLYNQNITYEYDNDEQHKKNDVDDDDQNSVCSNHIENKKERKEDDEVESHNIKLEVLASNNYDNETDEDGIADSEYSESDEENNRDDFIISDNSESEDDNEAILALEADAQLSIDDLRAKYKLMSKNIDSDDASITITNKGAHDQDTESKDITLTSPNITSTNLENEKNEDSNITIAEIGKHSMDISDNEQSNESKRRKLDTSDDSIKINGNTAISTVCNDTNNTSTDNIKNEYVNDKKDNNEIEVVVDDDIDEDDDDRTVTDYGSEPPEDDDEIVEHDNGHKEVATVTSNGLEKFKEEKNINESEGTNELVDDTIEHQIKSQQQETTTESALENEPMTITNSEIKADHESTNENETINANKNADASELMNLNTMTDDDDGIEYGINKKYESSTYETENEDKEAAVQPTGTTLSTTKVSTRIPFLLRGTLREYQHVGLDWLISLYNNGLNGILADEMGLGKTIQTIALLASLACEKGIWGPHLVVVPTSVILNWEMEFKKWLPGFKILTYFGSPKERKEKRLGWSKPNAFHVCITSYQLVLQDQSAFKRKPWQYLILDEAHHIKNFRSQRWQVLLNFNSKRRLLLTGTPLQNNLMELWSLLYFLMPNGISSNMPVGFANLKEFQEWFSNPVDLMIEGQEGMTEESRNAIQKLHTVLRPYLLRRLKLDVEQQMPAKYEHIMYCKLSKRQRYLYDDFMGRAKTKETLASGNFLSIINTLMQLRKVCNHPDLFEERPIITSFCMTNEILDKGNLLKKWVLRHWDINNDENKIDLESVHLAFVQPTLEMTSCKLIADDYALLDCSKQIVKTIQQIQTQVVNNGIHSRTIQSGKKYVDLKTHHKSYQMQKQLATAQRWQSILNRNQLRCNSQRPLYGIGLIEKCQQMYAKPHHLKFFPTPKNNYHLDTITYLNRADRIRQCVSSYEERIQKSIDIIKQYTFVTPAAIVQLPPSFISNNLRKIPFIPINYNPYHINNNNNNQNNVYYHHQQQQQQNPSTLALTSYSSSTSYINSYKIKDIFHPISSRLNIAFPDKRLLQYDCGKLQRLATLLQELSAGEHRALIFTQMTRVLDILEAFLNMHGYRYLRLDGATKVEQRQILTERFNNDKRILCFILSTRSGGLGINLTGADTVIFYDSDWNPSMDKQCQDRAHRIGQLRDVHIYRFVTEFTIEENIFKKANQKRLLDDMVIQEGEFTNDYFQKMDWWRDLPEVVGSMESNKLQNKETKESSNSNIDMEQALLEAEGDELDAQAAIAARNEMTMDDHEFDESTSSTPKLLASASPSKYNSPKINISNKSTPMQTSTSPSPTLSPSLHHPQSPTLSSYETSIITPTLSINKSKNKNAHVDISNFDNPNIGDNDDNNDEGDTIEVGHVDQYMLRFWEREVFEQYLGFGGLPEPIDSD